MPISRQWWQRRYSAWAAKEHPATRYALGLQKPAGTQSMSASLMSSVSESFSHPLSGNLAELV